MILYKFWSKLSQLKRSTVYSFSLLYKITFFSKESGDLY